MLITSNKKAVKKIISIYSLFAVCFLLGSFSPKFKPVFSIKTVVIDAGHGGKDPGCHGSKHKEKDIALAVALKLGKYIEENLKLILFLTKFIQRTCMKRIKKFHYVYY